MDSAELISGLPVFVEVCDFCTYFKPWSDDIMLVFRTVSRMQADSSIQVKTN